MSLQIWLPLNGNGNLKNQGLADVTVTNNGATYNSNGKIGGCYKVNGAQLSIPSASYMEMKSGKLFSFACWAKGATSSGWFIACSGWEIQFLTGHINVYPGGSSDGRDSNFSGATAVDLWRHIAFTWDGSNLILYVDGNALNTSTFNVSYNISSNINFCYQGERYLNDIRIYDHCLTPQEVKEISKGLVAHYTLGLNSLSQGNNIMSASLGGWDNNGTSSRNSNDTSYSGVPGGGTVYSITKSTQGQSAISIGSVSLTAGHYYRCMCWVYYTGSDTWSNFYVRQVDSRIGSFKYNGIADSRLWPRGKWIPVEAIITPASTANGIYFCDYIETANSKKAYTGWLVREIGTGIIYDSSGYSRNLTITSTSNLSIDSNTPRYDKAVKFNGLSGAVGPSPFGARAVDELTVSFWHKPNSSTGTYGTIIADSNPHSGFWMQLRGENPVLYYGGSWYVYNTTTISVDTWYHIVLTYKNSTYQFYVNGQPVTTTTRGTFKAPTFTSDIVIGCPLTTAGSSSSDHRQYGTTSDVRVYATALSADDVKDLYNLGALIS